MDSGNPLHLLDPYDDAGDRLPCLDIFDYVPGLPELPVEQLFEWALQHGGHKYVSLPLLRAMKAAANRPKDRADMENLSGESGRGHP